MSLPMASRFRLTVLADLRVATQLAPFAVDGIRGGAGPA